MTFPKPRNSLDGILSPWSQWSYPCDATHKGNNCKITFCENGHNCEGSCPVSSHSGIPNELNASNGQSCYWFSNGCTIGCPSCDGTNNHVGHGTQKFLYNSMNQTQLVENNMTIPNPFNPIVGSMVLDPEHRTFNITSNCDISYNATICDSKLRTCNTQAKCGSPNDYYYYSPWRAPGSAPVLDPCGIAGGRLEGQPIGPAGAQFENSTLAKRGDKGSSLFKPGTTGTGTGTGMRQSTTWKIGESYEVGWTVMANHGGGYQYRIAPITNEPLTEELFQKTALEYDGVSYLRWDGNVKTQLAYNTTELGWETNVGTLPIDSMWRKNPIPSGLWEREGPSFNPVCNETTECIQSYSAGKPFDSYDAGICKCSGFSNGGPLLPNLEIVDKVKIPTHLIPGRYALQWRWDCEESDQVWSSCSDVTLE